MRLTRCLIRAKAAAALLGFASSAETCWHSGSLK